MTSGLPRESTELNMLDTALAYAERGWPVLPLYEIGAAGRCTCGKECSSPGKHPRTEHGLKDATTQRERIKEWWGRWPNANIGIVTGARSGLVVIDVDGAAGRENFLGILQPHGFDLTTLISNTGGGGCHLFFQHPGVSISNSAGKIAPNVDARGEGGYVVAPPSLHATGLRYGWQNAEANIASLPSWLLEKLKDGGNSPLEGAVVANPEMIPNGQRNATLTSFAGSMRRRGMGEQAILAALLADNRERCRPPLPESEIRTIAASVSKYPPDAPEPMDEEPAGDKTTQVELLMRLGADAELFHTSNGEAHALVPVSGHRETWRIKDQAFKDWLVHRFYFHTGRAPNAQALRDSLGVFQCRARFNGPERQVFTRVAGVGDSVYLDLANQEWQVVEITSEGWRVITDPPVVFRRPDGMLPLPVPQHGGIIEELFKFVNITALRDRRLIIAWLVGCLRPTGPYPVLVLHGEHGSAKSTTAEVLRALIDPNGAPMRAEPREPRDLAIAAANSWIIGLDNLSYIKPWLSDNLCRLATGGGFGTRELYSDDAEKLFYAQRPIVINGIQELATKPDLLDRAIVLYLPHIPDEDRRPKTEFLRQFEDSRPQIVGALLDGVAGALRNVGKVRIKRYPRNADFAVWCTAAEEALGWEAGAFMDAYTGNRADANSLALEASPLTAPVLTLLQNGAWTGKATDLLKELTRVMPAGGLPQGWPKNGQTLSGKLRALTPNLRTMGIEVTFTHSGDRIIKLNKIASTASTASNSGPGEQLARTHSSPMDARPDVTDECAPTVSCSSTGDSDAVGGLDAIIPTEEIEVEL